MEKRAKEGDSPVQILTEAKPRMKGDIIVIMKRTLR